MIYSTNNKNKYKFYIEAIRRSNKLQENPAKSDKSL